MPKPNKLFVNDESTLDSCTADLLLGVDGLDEVLEAGRDDGRLADLVADLWAGVRAVDLVDELGAALLLAALAGLTGVLKSCTFGDPTVKLNSLMGETEERLLVELVFLVDCDLDADEAVLVVGLFLPVDAEAALFLIGVGVVLAFDDLGLGVPLMGFEARLAGV